MDTTLVSNISFLFAFSLSGKEFLWCCFSICHLHFKCFWMCTWWKYSKTIDYSVPVFSSGPVPLQGVLIYICAPVCADLYGGRGSEPGSLVNICFSVSETVIGLRVGCQSGVREAISVSWKIISSKYKFICFDMCKIMSSYCFNFLYICNVTIFMSHFVMFTFFFPQRNGWFVYFFSWNHLFICSTMFCFLII